MNEQPRSPSATRFASSRSVIGACAVGIAGAALFLALKLPLPFFLGSLTAAMVVAIAGAPVSMPKQVGAPLRAILGVAIGGAFTPELLARGSPMLVSLAFVLPWVALLAIVGHWCFHRWAGLDRATALFAAMPGGVSDIVLIAEDSGADVRTVTLIHLARIILVVFALPLYLQWHDGLSVGAQALVARSHLSDLSLGPALELLLLGIIGTLAAKTLRLAGPAIVGPMILSGLTHAFGFSSASVPFEIMTPTQVLLGILLGLQFRGLTREEVRTSLKFGMIFTCGLLVATPLYAEMVARLSGLSPMLTTMGYAPGGQAEINLLAFALHLDVAFVALHHLVRVALVMALVQIVARVETGPRPN